MTVKGLVLGCGLAVGFVTMPGVAFAASGYGPTAPTGPTGVPGGYTTVVVTQTVATSGGVVSGSVPGGLVQVSVPAGDFSSAVQVEVTAPDLASVSPGSLGWAGYTAVAGVGVKVLDTSGTPITGTFPKPIVVTVSGSGVTSGSRVVEFTSPTQVRAVSATASAGTIVISLTADPDLVVLAPPAAQPTAGIAGASSQNSGLPLTGERDAAVVLALLAGTATAVAIRRRRAGVR